MLGNRVRSTPNLVDSIETLRCDGDVLLVAHSAFEHQSISVGAIAESAPPVSELLREEGEKRLIRLQSCVQTSVKFVYLLSHLVGRIQVELPCAFLHVVRGAVRNCEHILLRPG